ncbi:hypothetical protein [Nocardioides sp. YIM 152588]|uniref:hypothetical protein n=1 Tax=Nocardioides sp. YIM 152588 TaxID=3158259 RepID=UPI0032E4D6B0
MSGERRTLHIHIGTPKSGTTFLQGALSTNRKLLRRAGFLYPGRNPGHFEEAMSLRESGFRGHWHPRAEGAWGRVVEEVHGFDGPALISHEILGSSDRTTLERARDSFPDHDVTIVITCRDLGRQLPAVWQEGIKNGNVGRYADFLGAAFDGWEGASTRHGVWGAQNVAALADHWGQVFGHDKVTLVTVPPSGSDPDALWQRFAAAVGLPDLQYAVADTPGNPSLGTVETELLRRVTTALPDDLPWPQHSRLVKRRFAQRRLVRFREGGMLGVPEDRQQPLREMSDAIVEDLRAHGYALHGDLADLEPSFRADGTLPDEVGDGQLLALALHVLVSMILEDPRTTRQRPGAPSGQRTASPAGDGSQGHALGRALARVRRVGRS